PVTGLAVAGNIAYLASGSDGLVVVDVHDLSSPLRIASIPVPGNVATDLDYHAVRGVLAMSAANDFGTGFVRFFDVQDPQLDSPSGFATLVFAEGDLRGRPLDLQWLEDALYVLLERDG